MYITTILQDIMDKKTHTHKKFMIHSNNTFVHEEFTTEWHHSRHTPHANRIKSWHILLKHLFNVPFTQVLYTPRYFSSMQINTHGGKVTAWLWNQSYCLSQVWILSLPTTNIQHKPCIQNKTWPILKPEMWNSWKLFLKHTVQSDLNIPCTLYQR